MAQFACVDCHYEGHYVEFKAPRQGDESADAFDDNDDFESPLECPVCMSESIYEL